MSNLLANSKMVSVTSSYGSFSGLSFLLFDSVCPLCGSENWNTQHITKYCCDICRKVFDHPITAKEYKRRTRHKKLERIMK